MASSSSGAHRLPPEALRNDDDRLVPDDFDADARQYTGDDSPTLRLVLPTGPAQTVAATAAPAGPSVDAPATPMARLRLQRRVIKRDPPRNDD